MKSDFEWKYWGAVDPFWSVAAWKGKEIGTSSAWTPAEFLRLGELDFADVWQQWRNYGVPTGTCVEIGCGAGRMTSQLLNHFASVLGIDVSTAQIAKAKEILGSAAARVEFRVVEDPTIPAADESCDAMFSSHVFQHLPDIAAIRAYLSESFRVVRPAGTICFHLPVPGAHLTAHQSLLWLWLRNCYKKVKRTLRVPRIMEYHRYRIPVMLKMLAEVGFVDAELRLFAMHSNGDYHSFFLARKP